MCGRACLCGVPGFNLQSRLVGTGLGTSWEPLNYFAKACIAQERHALYPYKIRQFPATEHAGGKGSKSVAVA